jgi:large subunit ribosomal protein L19
MKAIETIESADLKKALPQLNPGDTVRVHVRVKETAVKEERGKSKETERERVQVFEGLVIGLRGSGVRATMTVRKVSFGHGVERIFPLHARTIEKIEVVKHARVRRAKLYFIRERKGKAGRMKEQRTEAQRTEVQPAQA